MKHDSDREKLLIDIKDFKEFENEYVDILITGDTTRHEGRSSDLLPEVITLFDQPLIDDLRVDIQKRPVSLEIGFGKGRSLLEYAALHPQRIVIGIEVRRGLCNRVVKRYKKRALSNVRIALGDAREVMPALFPESSIDEVFVLFPDPWWKKRHAKRRYGQIFFNMLAAHLKPGGLLVLKSDVQAYLEFLVHGVDQTGMFFPVEPPTDMPLTNREARLKANELPVFQVAFRLKPV